MKLRLVILGVLMLAVVSFQAMAASCLDTITSTNTEDLMDELDSMDFSACDSKLQGISDGEIELKVFMEDSTTQSAALTIKNKEITDGKKGGAKKAFLIATIGECELDTVLRSSNKGKVFAYAYLQKKANINAVGLWNKFKFMFVKPVISAAFKKIQQETTFACSDSSGKAKEKGEAGDVCSDGGDCKTGNCIYDRGEGANRIYRCSCDPFKLVIEPGCPKTPVYPESGKGKPGDICQHGGQCESGNCIGVIPGQLYKCSCDPNKYVTTGC